MTIPFKDLQGTNDNVYILAFGKISRKSIQFGSVKKLQTQVEFTIYVARVATENNKSCGRRSLIYVKNERKFEVTTAYPKGGPSVTTQRMPCLAYYVISN